jgi:phenylalanyl-tRNA synthetase alpha chain
MMMRATTPMMIGTMMICIRQSVSFQIPRIQTSQRIFKSALFSSTTTSTTPTTLGGYSLDAADCNVSPQVASKVGINLHQRPLHPLHTIQQKIVQYWNDDPTNAADGNMKFQVFDDIAPIVSCEQNFDRLRIPPDHISRSLSDTYYLDKTTVLRTHTSAHQVDLLRQGHNQFLVAGDVYRRDEIDQSHYPVFHQMEGVKMFDAATLAKCESEEAQVELIAKDLKEQLEGLAAHLFGPVEMRWVDEYFPFTHPSYELEIKFQDQWMEVLGCGVVHPEIVANADRPDEKGWAFGLGLERLAMILFNIPDIRLFWTDDDRFHSQFKSGEIVQFKPYSKYPPVYKDVSFWLYDTFHVNELNEVVRGVAGDLVEQLELLDKFTNPKTQKESHCYRITYRSMDRSLTNEEIDAIQEEVRAQLEKAGAELR